MSAPPDPEERLGWRFSQPQLLLEALTHSSFFEGKRGKGDNERLEFLGDRVLGLIVAEELFTRYANAPEADLARAFNALVRKSACAEAARRAGLGAHLRLSRAEEEAGGRTKETILADACEAVIAALYLDGGAAPARAFVLEQWGEAAFAQALAVRKDAKTELQEWAARRKRAAPAYKTLSRAGPDHAPRFEVAVEIVGMGSARGAGGALREAEQAAAQAFLKEFGGE